MITCKLGNMSYSVDFVSGRALREIDSAAKMYARLVRVAQQAERGEDPGADAALTVREALDVMVQWFCLLFRNQFTPDDVYDFYPADRLSHDIALALMAVQTQTTAALDEFPTIPVAEEAEILMKRSTRTRTKKP